MLSELLKPILYLLLQEVAGYSASFYGRNLVKKTSYSGSPARIYAKNRTRSASVKKRSRFTTITYPFFHQKRRVSYIISFLNVSQSCNRQA